MQKEIISLNDLAVNKTGVVVSLLSKGNERRRMLDLGLVKGTKVEAVYKSPAGDPTAYFVRGTLMAIRGEDAAKCLVEI